MTNQNQIPQIEPMPLSELQDAVIAAQDDMQSWELVSSAFRLIRHKGEIWCIMPTARLKVAELSLFTNARVSKYAIAVKALEGDNLQMFFMAAIQAQESSIRLENKVD